MDFAQWLTLRRFWGKFQLPLNGASTWNWLPLEHHCIDVACVFLELLTGTRLGDVLRKTTDRFSEGHARRLAVIAGLHDIGKANLGFQSKVFQRGVFGPVAGHTRLELQLLFQGSGRLQQLADALDVERLQTWFESTTALTDGAPSALESLLFAAWSHHGAPVCFEKKPAPPGAARVWQPHEGFDPVQGIALIRQVMERTFPDAFQATAEPLAVSPALQHEFCGLVMLADWLGSHRDYFPFTRDSMTISERMELARHNARCIVRDIGLKTFENARARSAVTESCKSFDQAFGFPPRALQAAIAAADLDDERNAVLVAESDTGSGKTEAALFWLARLLAAGRVDGLYFALPTRVAARELYKRVCAFVHRVFPQDARPAVVLAVPGYAQISDVVGLPPSTTRYDEHQSELAMRRWAIENPKRFLAAPIVVGTVDQALMSTLQVPHAHLRATCLNRHLLVVDEVHSSDVYMRGLLKQLLMHRRAQGCFSVLLSATLTDVARAELLGAVPQAPTVEQACVLPYPALTGLQGHTLDMPPAEPRAKEVTVELLPAMQELKTVVTHVTQAISAGGRVLCVLNTVARAVGLQRLLEAALGQTHLALFRVSGVVVPHHGRFAAADRAKMDEGVTRALGKHSASGACLLVGTQTLEQSLDIDADLLMTDLCPMDVLLQRLGRLWRHNRQRPAAFVHARCLLLSPEGPLESFLTKGGRVSGVASRMGLGSVYEDVGALELTRRFFMTRSQIQLPRDNRLLVESALHPEVLQTLAAPAWKEHRMALEGGAMAEQMQSRQVGLARLRGQAFGTFAFNDDKALAAVTRLGAGSIEVQLRSPINSPLGETVDKLVLSPHWLRQGLQPVDLEVVPKSCQGGFEFDYSGRVFRYSRMGLEAL